MGKKSWFLSLEVWLCVGMVLGTPQRLFKDSPLFWKNLNFWRLAIENRTLALAFGLWTRWALRFGFGMGVVPIDVFLVHLGFGAKFPRWKFGSALPQVHHSTQNTILTNLLLWEYSNGGAPFSRWKSSSVLRLVCYGAPSGFCISVYGVYWHAHTEISRSPSKH